MKRREFSKSIALIGLGAQAGFAGGLSQSTEEQDGYYEEPAKRIPIRKFDVVVAGGGTAGTSPEAR